MPFIEINGANIYYESFGTDRSDRAPIVLIHGSTITGQADWHAIAPLLATEYRVIVPDCRGHGQSSNPNHSYSFKELAADMAALIRALGYERAHIIGHSNGGNVALVTLLEHPEVVQTCIPQAANAYVTPYLIDREPAVFDPDRVAREAPDWMNRDDRAARPHARVGLLARIAAVDAARDHHRAELYARRSGAGSTARSSSFKAPTMSSMRPIGTRSSSRSTSLTPSYGCRPQVAHSVHLEIPLEWLTRVLRFSGAPWRRSQRCAVSSAPRALCRHARNDLRCAVLPLSS